MVQKLAFGLLLAHSPLVDHWPISGPEKPTFSQPLANFRTRKPSLGPGSKSRPLLAYLRTKNPVLDQKAVLDHGQFLPQRSLQKARFSDP
jgi:hypothetical protein